MVCHSSSTFSEVLFATAVIVRAFIDPGADCSFISSRIVELLSLREERVKMKISGICTVLTTVSSRVVVRLSSLSDSDFPVALSALVLSKLTSSLPQGVVENHDSYI